MLAEYSYTNNEAPEEKEFAEFTETGDTDSLKQYLREIGRYDLLSEEETKTLFKRIESGDKAAHDVVVEHNLRLVVKYAKSIKKAYRADEPIMDLVQAGNIGLMRAVDKFEVDKGYAFSTYASWWIKQSIIRHIFDNESSIRVPVHMSERFVTLSRTIRTFREEKGVEPTFEELSKLIKVTKKEYDIFKSLDRNVISLNSIVSEDTDSELIDFVPGGDTADPVYLAADLMSQAEHDRLASAILLCTSEKIAQKTIEEIERQSLSLSRREMILDSLENFGAVIVCRDFEQMVQLANEIAPEHLEVMVQNPLETVGRFDNAGSVFLGRYSPEPLGDYFAGPNHVLPTSGTARFFSPLSVDSFIKRSSFIYYPKDALRCAAEDIVAIAQKEGLTAHANAITVRF